MTMLDAMYGNAKIKVLEDSEYELLKGAYACLIHAGDLIAQPIDACMVWLPLYGFVQIIMCKSLLLVSVVSITHNKYYT